jgi:hypothetical protein
MPFSRWLDFATHIRNLLTRTNSEVYVDAAESVGEWEGVAEDSLTWVASVDEDNLDFTRGYLARTAEIYNQDAIALTVGETELISGDNNA